MKTFTQHEMYKNAMDKRREAYFVLIQEKSSQDRMDAIGQIPLAKKIDICQDLSLFNDSDLAELIYNSSMTLDEILEETLPF